jgi:hypothetical protein
MDTELDTTLDDIDATDLVIEELPVDDDGGDYDEIVITLDLRRPESHDLWLN